MHSASCASLGLLSTTASDECQEHSPADNCHQSGFFDVNFHTIIPFLVIPKKCFKGSANYLILVILRKSFRSPKEILRITKEVFVITTTTITKYKKHIIIGICILIVLLGLHWFLSRSPKVSQDTPTTTDPPLPITSTATVQAVPKAAPKDNDVEITQTYKANINGVTVTAPVKTTQADTYGTKGIIKQEIDLAPVVNLAKAQGIQEATKEFKKNWEGSIGVGVHDGDVYVPLELQRNYSADKAISLEVHLDPKDDFKVNGGEVKHTWKF